MSADVAAQRGVPAIVRPWGSERGRPDAIQGALLGGEGNGGVIDPRVVLVRDSFVGWLWTLDAMAARRQPISSLAAELPRYEIAKTKCALAPEKIAAGLEALEKHFAAPESSRLDGLRLFLTGPANGSWCAPATRTRRARYRRSPLPWPKQRGSAPKHKRFWPASSFLGESTRRSFAKLFGFGGRDEAIMIAVERFKLGPVPRNSRG